MAEYCDKEKGTTLSYTTFILTKLVEFWDVYIGVCFYFLSHK